MARSARCQTKTSVGVMLHALVDFFSDLRLEHLFKTFPLWISPHYLGECSVWLNVISSFFEHFKKIVCSKFFQWSAVYNEIYKKFNRSCLLKVHSSFSSRKKRLLIFKTKKMMLQLTFLIDANKWLFSLQVFSRLTFLITPCLFVTF